MKLLAWFTNNWQEYLGNAMPALIRSMQADPEITVVMNGDATNHNDYDAIITDLDGPRIFHRGAIQIAYCEDMHRFTASAARHSWDERAPWYDLILTPYYLATPSKNLYHWPPPEARAKFVFFPHWVPDEPPPPAGARRGGILSGNLDGRVYPWRAWVKSLNLAGVDILPHPGYDNLGAMSNSRDSYFARLSQYIAGFTCNSILDYTVAKYFEIPYAGCVLLAAWPNLTDIELLGFVDGVNCLFVGENNETYLRKVVTHMLSKNDAGQVAENGQQLVLSRHTASHRIAYLKRIVRWYQEHRRVPSADEQKELFSERTT